MNIRITVPNSYRAFTDGRLAAEMIKETGQEIQNSLGRTIADIRARDGQIFDNPTGALTGSLWQSPSKKAGKRVRGEAGWGVPYGKLLEDGPPGGKLVIKPSGLTKDGEPVSALRFIIDGQLLYRKSVTLTMKSRRRHWGPAWKREAPAFRRNMARVAPRAMRTLGIV